MKSLMLLSVFLGILLASAAFAELYFKPFEITVSEELFVEAGSTVSLRINASSNFDKNMSLKILVSGAVEASETLDLLPKETKELEINVSIPSYLEGEQKIYVKASALNWFDFKVINLTVTKPAVPKARIEYFVLPETVTVDKEFSFGIGIRNDESKAIKVNVSLELPENWSLFPTEIQDEVKPGETKVVYFAVTPAINEGEIKANIVYMLDEKTFQIDRKTDVLVPQEVEVMPPVMPVGFYILITEAPILFVTIVLAIIAVTAIILRATIVKTRQKKK